MPKYDVVGIGRPYADLLIPVPHMPRRDEVLPVEHIEQQGGGPVPTALVTLSRLGASAAIWGRVGDDPYGDFIIEDFRRYGVSTDFIEVCPGYRSPVSVILVDGSTGTRAILHCAGQIPAPGVADVRADVVQGCRVLHLSGSYMEAEIEAARVAREAGVLVSVDGSAGARKARVAELIAAADVLVAARPFAEQETGQTDLHACAAELLNRGPHTVVITTGASGSYGWTLDGQTHHQPAFPVKVIDTTGAGDVYHGAFVYGLVRGWSLARNMAFATATAALKCTQVGGRAGIPALHEVEQFLVCRSRL